jgi:hypothetical protein
VAARQLILDLLARDKTGPGAKGAANNLKTVGDAAEDAADSTERLGAASDKADDEAEDLGRAAKRAADGVEKLDREIESCEKELKQLAVSFAEAQSAADRLDIKRAIRRTQGDLRDLNKSRGMLAAMLPSPAEVVSAGADVGKGFGKSVSTALEAAGPQVKGALIGTAVLAAPLIGSTIAGAVVSGVGAGVVAGGIMLAAKDPRVAAAGKTLSSKLMSGLQSDSESFIAPVLRNVDKIGDRFDTLRPRFKRIFANASEFVDPLTDGVLDGVDKLTEGLEVLTAKGGPAIDALGGVITELGDATGDAFAVMAGGSEDAAKGLELFGQIAGSSIRGVGMLVRGLTEAYGAMDDFGSSVNGTVRGWFGLSEATEDAGDKASEAAVAVDSLGENTVLMGMKAQGASGPIVTLSTEINDLADASRDAFDVATDVGAALDEVTEAAKRNGATLSASTEKGRENRQALSGLRDALIAEYNAMVAVNGEGEKANSVAARNRDRFIAAARAFGESAEGAERLATEMGLIPVRKSVSISENFGAVRARAAAIQRELDSIPRTIRTRVIVTRQGDITYAGGGGRQAPMREHGGPVKQGHAYVVGEKRPEVFVPDRDGQIIPSIEKYSRAAGVAGTRRAEAPVAMLAVDPSGALDELERLFLKMLRVRPGFRATVKQYVGS